jgi:hypothetical protein
MLGGVLKLAFSFSALFLFITLIWQASIADALPVNILEIKSIFVLIYEKKNTCCVQISVQVSRKYLKESAFEKSLNLFSSLCTEEMILNLEKNMNNIPSN